jgi:hypothetical protein
VGYGYNLVLQYLSSWQARISPKAAKLINNVFIPEMKISLVVCSGYQYLTHNKQCYQVPSSFRFQVPRIAGLEVNDSFMIVFVILHVLNALL